MAMPRLQLYNMAALCTQEDLESQKHYLQLEYGIMRRFYPDEAERQEEEIEPLLKCSQPTEDGPRMQVLNWWQLQLPRARIKACVAQSANLAEVYVTVWSQLSGTWQLRKVEFQEKTSPWSCLFFMFTIKVNRGVQYFFLSDVVL